MDNYSKEIKNALDPYVSIVSKDLIDQLIKDDLIEIKGESENKTYHLSKKTLEKRTTTSIPLSESSVTKEELSNFFRIMNRVYQVTNTSTELQPTLKEELEHFQSKNAVSLPSNYTLSLNTILEKQAPVSIDDLDDSLLGFLNENELTIPSYKTQILQHYIAEEFQKAYKNLSFESSLKEPYKSQYPLIGQSSYQGDPDVVIDFIYRIKPLDTLIEDISRSHERLEQYDILTSKRNFLILLIVSDLSEISTDSASKQFDTYIKEKLPSYADRIVLLITSLQELGSVHDALAKIKSKVSNIQPGIASSPVNDFVLDNQTNQLEINPIFDLNDYYYEITFAPQALLLDWKVGFKFSRDDNFSDVTKDIIGHPVLYLGQEQFQSAPLTATYYNGELERQYSKNLVGTYNRSVLTIWITEENGAAKIEILDTARNHLSDQLIPKFLKFKIFAKTGQGGRFKANFSILKRKKGT